MTSKKRAPAPRPNALQQIQRLEEQLKARTLLPKTFFQGVRPEDYWLSNSGLVESEASDAVYAALTVPHPPELIAIRKSIADEVRDQAGEALEDARFGDPKYWRHLAEHVSQHVTMLVNTLFAGISAPYYNGLYLTYRAGRFSFPGLKIDGQLSDFFDVTADEAARLLDEAIPRRAQEKAREEAEQREAEERRTAESQRRAEQANAFGGRMPSGEFLLKDLPGANFQVEPGDRIATHPGELKGASGVPPIWKEFLRAQAAGDEIPWDTLWGGCADEMPAALEFLHQKCRGVAVLVRKKGPPGLLYVYCFQTDKIPFCYGAYLGEKPLGTRVPAGCRATFQLLPAGLQRFCQEVHNGWAEAGFTVYGPLSVQKMKFLSDNVNQEEAFGKRKAPYDVEKTLEVMRLGGGGDALCLDTGMKPQDGVYPGAMWYCRGAPRSSGLDFWKVFNREMRRAIKEKLKKTIVAET